MPRASKETSPVEIVWEAPPPRVPSSPNPYADAVAEVKKTPGRWARIRVFETQSPAYNSKKIAQTVAAAPEWEIVVRRIREDGQPERYGLWVRFRTPEQMAAVGR